MLGAADGALRMRAVIIALLVALAVFSRHVRADTVGVEVPAVTPYRPTVSTPAALSAPGWAETEADVSMSEGGEPARRDALPYTFKYAFSPYCGVRLEGEALVRGYDPAGRRSTGFGRASLVLKNRLPINESAAFGL